MNTAVIAIPPIRDFYFTPHRASALGARALNRELMDSGWDTTLINFPLRGKTRSISLPSEIAYLKKYLIHNESGPLSWFTSYRHFGPSLPDAAEIIAAEKPEVLFISSFAWAYADESLELADAAARKIPGLPIVIGGHGPTSLPEFFLNAAHPVFPEQPLFTLVVAGEIEGYGKLLNAYLDTGRITGIKGRYLDLRKSGVPGILQPISGESIRRGGRRVISIALTRGCPKKCRFCSNYICHGRKFRSSEPGMWIEEAVSTFKQKNDNSESIHLNIEDDNILFLKKEFFSFLESLKSRYNDITFSAENGLDYMLIDEKDVSRLKTLGFTQINFSLGVLSSKSRKKECRDGNPEKLENLIKLCKKVDLPVTTHFICGLSGDTPEDIVSTLQFLDKLPTQTGISNFYPVPGLPGFTEKSLFLERHPHPEKQAAWGLNCKKRHTVLQKLLDLKGNVKGTALPSIPAKEGGLRSGKPRLALGSSVYPWTGALSSAGMLTAFRLSRWINFKKRMEQSFDASRVSEKELYSTILQSSRLHTIIRERNNRHNHEIVPIPYLDEAMVEGFFS